MRTITLIRQPIDRLRVKLGLPAMEGQPSPQLTPLLAIFLAGLLALAAIVAGLTVRTAGVDWVALGLGAILIFILNATAVAAVSGVNTRWSAAGYIHLAQAVVIGPIGSLAVALAGTAGNLVRLPPGKIRTTFNIPMHFLKDVAAWYVFFHLSNASSSLLIHGLAGVAAGLTQLIVNTTLLSVALKITDSATDLVTFARESVALFLPYNVGYGWAAYGAIVLHDHAGAYGFSFLLFPVLLAQLFLVALGRRVAEQERARREHAMEREALMRRTLDASEAERRRITRDLHDGVVQDLAVLASGLRTHAKNQHTDPLMAPVLLRAGDAAAEAMDELRILLRDMAPPDLERIGFAAAVGDLFEPLKGRGVELKVNLPEKLNDPDLIRTLYRFVQEAMRNVNKHAEATVVEVNGGQDDQGRLWVSVTDNGRGFMASDLSDKRAAGHIGLSLLNDLATEHGGEVHVSSAEGEGTTVILRLPKVHK